MFHNKEINAAGCYLVKFYVNGVPKGVMVDDTFLVADNHLEFAQCKNDEIWVPLIEKAWAKLLGSYARIDGAFLECEVMHILTGAPAKYINHDQFLKDNSKKDKHWETLKSCD